MLKNTYCSNSPLKSLLIGIFLFLSAGLYSQTIKTSGSGGNWTQITWSPAGIPAVHDDVVINRRVVIPEGTTVEIQNLEIAKDGILVVDGILKVKGNLLMSHNSSVFEMGDTAYVIVNGNFGASNQVSISVSSYLIIYGDFTKTGSSTQGELTVEGGNIYIFGEVDENWNNFETCEEYIGDTGAIESENCDYGTGENFEDNQDSFPDDLIDAINCYDLARITDQNVCDGQTATFNVPLFSGVTYEWQKKLNGTWIPAGSNTHIFTAPTSSSDNGNLYRVIVKDSEDSSCKLSISRAVMLNVQPAGTWTGEEDSNWNNPANWSCNSLPTMETDVIISSGSENYPLINSGANATTRDLTIETGAEITVSNNWLRIAGDFNASEAISAENGSVSFEGTSAQTIPSGAFEGNRVLNLRTNNPAGVTSEGLIEIINSLKVEEGNFHTGDNLILLSDASGTAFIDGSGNGEVTGTVTMQRYLSNGFGYKYFSSPFSNSTVADFAAFMDLKDATTGFPHFYEYREDNKDVNQNDLTGWKAYTETGSSLNIAQGYALNLSGLNDPVTLEVSGEANNGDLEIYLQNSGGSYTNGFNLVGNPYPSPIDWNLMTPFLEEVDDAIHFFTAGSDNRYTGTYTSFVNGVSTDERSSNIIPSMQGFFVRVSDPEDGVYPVAATLSFTNSVRTGNDNPQEFYKTGNSRAIPQIRLSAGFSNEKVSDATVIYFQPGASAEFEKDLDAFKMMNTAAEVPSLYSLTGKQEKLSINAISSSDNQEIPLGVKAERSGEMYIELAQLENVFTTAYIYLKDKKAKVVHNLSEKPIYSFTSQKGENNDRFILMFSSEKLSENEMVTALEPFSVHSAEGEILVKLNLTENAAGNVILRNISGQKLQQKRGKEKEELRFSGFTAPGVYLISLELGKEQTTKKILLKK